MFSSSEEIEELEIQLIEGYRKLIFRLENEYYNGVWNSKSIGESGEHLPLTAEEETLLKEGVEKSISALMNRMSGLAKAHHKGNLLAKLRTKFPWNVVHVAYLQGAKKEIYEYLEASIDDPRYWDEYIKVTNGTYFWKEPPENLEDYDFLRSV